MGANGEHRLQTTTLSHVALRSGDVPGMVEFYEDVLGLRVHEQLAGGGSRLGWGTGHHVLDLLPGEPGLDHYGLEVRDPGGPEALAARLEALGGRPERRAAAGAHPAAVACRDPDGNLVEVHGRVDRSGEHAADSGRRPVRVQHITLATRGLDEMVAFYTGLGFQVADRMEGTFTWLRCDSLHHTVAVVLSRGTGALDHYSYDVQSWDDFKTWCDRLGSARVPVCWGPARHGPGNNLFIMFQDPDGNRIELSAEMEQFWDRTATYEPRQWRNDPWTINVWGGVGPEWRSH
jgi:catechol 2,3-dioxygenase-like lactoylglutathione lyase family enzyme